MERQQVSINEMRGISECAAPRPTGMNEQEHAVIAAQVDEFLARGGQVEVLPSNFATNPTYSFDKSRIISRG